MNKLLTTKNRLAKAIERLENAIEKTLIKNATSYELAQQELKLKEVITENESLKKQLLKSKSTTHEIAEELTETIKQLNLLIEQQQEHVSN
ncbi:hypothetical protein [Rickettsiales endosymbiont of Stachyamoeba lipophora]|uniref:hypothetical protein n=1 Tax=Rickettsiales endosymbiont of Stachyamoeba lipophora TaxID=2486578 RepID=UPI000F64FE86|nr:hypothetical protein [Rickettsiales endosymbiont of Stachyamoeba lipophora]AZL15625.1 hypothetical protein EF513_03560 [Rickettsiales endosymbiont of Stachyamoeba lipophora]